MKTARRPQANVTSLPIRLSCSTWIAKALRRSGLRADGVNLFLADGAAAGQEVFHCHLHVSPRYPGDGVTLSVGRQPRERAELDATASLIGRALAAPTD